MRLTYQGLSVIAIVVLHPDFEDCYVAAAYFEDTGEYLSEMELEHLRNYNLYILQDRHQEYLEDVA